MPRRKRAAPSGDAISALLERVERQIRKQRSAPLPLLSEVLSSDETPEQRASSLVSYVGEKSRRHGWESLTELERLVEQVDQYRFKLMNGGISSTVISDPPPYRDQCIAALETVGALRTASILRRAAVLVDGIERDEVGPDRTVGEVIDRLGSEYERIEAELSALDAGEEIDDALTRWVAEHTRELSAS